MRTPDKRSKFLDHMLTNSEQPRYWVENCSWEPGTGYCRKYRSAECINECTFRHLRKAEADLIRRNRQQRRPIQQ